MAVDIKSETQLAEEEAYGDVDWAEGEWVLDPESGEQVWKPADGGDAVSAEQWSAGDGEVEEPSEASADDEPVVASTEGASEEE